MYCRPTIHVHVHTVHHVHVYCTHVHTCIHHVHTCIHHLHVHVYMYIMAEVSWLSGSDRGLASSRSPVRNPGRGGCALGQGTFSSLSIGEYRRVTPCARKRSHFTSRKE